MKPLWEYIYNLIIDYLNYKFVAPDMSFSIMDTIYFGVFGVCGVGIIHKIYTHVYDIYWGD